MALLLVLIGWFCGAMLWRDLVHSTFHEPFTPWLLVWWPLAVYVTCLGIAVTWSMFAEGAFHRGER